MAGFRGLGKDGTYRGDRGWGGGRGQGFAAQGRDRALGLRGKECRGWSRGRWHAPDGGDTEAEGDGLVVGVRVAEAYEGGHDERIGSVLGLGAEEEVDAGLVYAGVGGRCLREDHVGIARGVEANLGAEVELVAAEVHGGLADGFAGDVRNGDLLGSEAFDDANLPAFADLGAGRGGLGEDAARGDGGGVEAVLDIEVEAGVKGGVGGFLDG